MKHIKMKKADAEKWLAALRSGQYEQSKSKMFDGQGYCCLGVLQMELGGEIVKQEPMELPSYSWLVSKGITFYNAEGYTTYSPNIGDSHNNSASSLNDCGVSFLELADLLEREIEYTDIQEGEVA
ncbi:MAG TPA: hypothetical protein VIY48_00610 [Candidatus Paceibacterota bacterium]